MQKEQKGYRVHIYKVYCMASLLMSFLVSHAQSVAPRIVVNINTGWQFLKANALTDKSTWQSVDLPHTWNTADVMDDEPGYYRGVAWYKKTITLDKKLLGKELSIYFEGVNQVAEVFINGKKAAHHIGGYSGFSIAATPFLNTSGKNELLVKVDNSHNEHIPPLSADFTFFGGIYRDVYLTATNKVLLRNDDAGSSGVYITTPLVSKEIATVSIRSLLQNKTSKSVTLHLINSIKNKQGIQVTEVKTVTTLVANSNKEIKQAIPAIKNPMLWSPEQPYLYTVETIIKDAKGHVIDKVTNPLGFRWFSFNAAKGFYLNGAPYKLIGASRHQDYKGMGNAVPDSLAIRDLVLLKEMGGNFLRVAHYPQDPVVMRTCDSLGLLASVEIPIVNEISETDSFYQNSEQMMIEMIRQHFNHPSVIMWCYMNEVLLRPHFNNDKEKQKVYFANINALAKRLEALTRKEDPGRYTMMANHGNLGQYKNVGLIQIPMVVGWNLYSGWYGANREEFPKFLDEFHADFPDKPFFVSEYGADADPRIRSSQPVRFDKSIEYTTRFHHYYITEMLKRPFVAGAAVWNLADFNSETRTETMPHINNKGLLEWDRTPKDPYFFYQALLAKKPYIKIIGPGERRYGMADSATKTATQLVQVVSNLEAVTIYLNGAKQGSFPVNNGLAETKLSFGQGKNIINVEGVRQGKMYTDSITTTMSIQPYSLVDTQLLFQPMNILLGTTRQFIDEKGQWWQPDQQYIEGRWGAIGGTWFKLENNGRLPFGTDKNILGTDGDPIYQTQQIGIRQYKLHVPAGKYELTLHFAELLGGSVQDLPYNLSNSQRNEQKQKRVFNVSVNGQKLLQQFNMTETHGLARPVVKTATVIVKDAEGVVIEFEPIEGAPVLNALQIKKLDDVVGK